MRARARLWRRGAVALQRPRDPPERVRWYVRSFAIAAVAIASGLSVVVLVNRVRVAWLDASAAGHGLDTAAGMVCLSAASWVVLSGARGRRTAGVALAALAMAIGAAALLEHLVNPPPHAGWGVALLLVCVGCGAALGAADSRRVRVAGDALVLAAAAICLFAVAARLLGAHSQVPLVTRDQVLPFAAIIGFALSSALVLERPERGLGQLLNSSASGGVLARRLIPILIVAPIAIARLALLGIDAEAFDIGVAAALCVVASVVVLVVVLVASARAVDRLEAVRRGNEAQIRQMVQDIARHSEEVHRTNRELESFSYSISHDLRAPIRHIAGFAELLGNHARARLDAKGEKYLANISESAENAALLIDELLEFSRIGRSALHPRDLDIADIVRDAWTKLVLERAGRDIELRLDALPAIHADATLTGQVVANLMSNAVKYTAARPHAVIAVTAQRDGELVVFEVRDNGAGFDMKYADKLFGVFQRLHGDEFPGTGIGLATVKRIVERHGGRVWAEGALDAGAAFRFSLPRAKEPP